jgi:hypothetical protein
MRRKQEVRTPEVTLAELVADAERRAEERRDENEGRATYVSGSEARRLTGFGAGRLNRLAVLKQIAVKLVPGVPPRYSRRDILALSRQSKASV